MIAEHPAVLETDSPPAQIAIKPAANGEVGASRFFTPADKRGSSELGQPVLIVCPEPEDAADHRDMIRLVAGQEDAFQSLTNRHADALYSQLARVLRNRTEARDSLEEAFVRVYLHRGRFDFKRKFSAWLYAIAFNLARDQLRRRARRPEFISMDDPQESNELAEILIDHEQPPDKRLDNQERYGSLAEAVDALPEALRQPLVLFAFEEKSQTKIAAEMHCTAKAVEMRLYHARKQLNSVLQKAFNERRGFYVRGRSNPQSSAKT